jgi:NTE family protein
MDYTNDQIAAALRPVRPIPGDPPGDQPEEGIALCLSGGGYRAMLFHLGALWRLNELAYLPRLDRVSSVSGGSITAAALAAAWLRLDFDDRGQARALVEEVVGPVRALAARTIDIPAVLLGLGLPGSAADRLAAAYRRHLLGGLTLRDLPPDPAPRFVINSTNVQSGVLWRFSRPYMWDYRVGKVEEPKVELATAVAASSAFPPFLSPLRLRLAEGSIIVGTGTDLERAPFTSRAVLTDGGVYDNLGLETAWKRYRTVLVSDGGGALKPQGRPSRLWPLHAFRTLFLVDSQVRALRKRQLIASYRAKREDGEPIRRGAYWGIRSHIPDFGIPDPLAPPEDTAVLAEEPTRLKALSERAQKRLVNWGYVITDTAMRRHVEPQAPKPDAVPYPEQA